ncbi:MAG TPA: T9SS type A sorting domain-containing protein [Prolixibacteraceae bacterium]|nr:T9SS type A sorting domain-containing protein [Prolixibacteraceae bacterium]
MKDYNGNKFWKLDENNCKKNLIPAIVIPLSKSEGYRNLFLGIKPTPGFPISIDESYVRIHEQFGKSRDLVISNHPSEDHFNHNAKNNSGQETGTIAIFGALLSHFKIDNTTMNEIYFSEKNNLRLVQINNCDFLMNVYLHDQKLLEKAFVFANDRLISLDLRNSSKLRILHADRNPILSTLIFNSEKLEVLIFRESPGLKPDLIIGDLARATNLKKINLGNLGWDACQMNEFYLRLKNNPPNNPYLLVDDASSSLKSNDFSLSNHTIANNKGWNVFRERDGNTKNLTGDGGGCSYTEIPDADFLQVLKTLGYGAGADGNKIPTSNLSAITELYVSDKNISDLTGIQDFVALTLLDCYNNQLSSLNVSKNTKLTELYCYNNQLSSLDLSENTALTYLYCHKNSISSLDVSKNTKLKNLLCYNNQLTSLDVKNGTNAQIRVFDAINNPNLTCILVDNKVATYLTTIWKKDDTAKWANNESECGTVAYTQIRDANFRQALKDLGHGDGAVGDKIPTANLSVITTLEVNNKDISDLTGIQDFVALEQLVCYENTLSSLDVSRNTKLTKLHCSNNKTLSSLNLSKNTALEELLCSNNNLPDLDVSKNIQLRVLYCKSINLTKLNVSKNTKLTNLYCSDNNALSSLNLSKNTALKYLDCENNQLTSLDVRSRNNANIAGFDATNNPDLTCIYVDNKAATYLTTRWKKDATAKWANNESECGMPAPVAVSNIAPLNGATNIENGLLLDWKFGANTSQYELVLGTTNPPTTEVVSYTSTLATSYVLNNLEQNKKYYWQVNAKNTTGTTPGPVWSFTTSSTPTPAPVAVSNIAPLNGATNIENGMLLNWKFGANTSQYELVLGTTNPPTNVMVPFTSTLATSYVLNNLEQNKKYYWRVNAKNTTGTTPGPVWSFTNGATSETIVVNIPADLPYADLGNTTCGKGNNYANSDLGSYGGGEDIIYQLNVTSTIEVSIKMDPKTTTYSGLGLFNAKPTKPLGAGNFWISVDRNAAERAITRTLSPGTYYVMADTWSELGCIPVLDLTITAVPTMVVVSNFPFIESFEPNSTTLASWRQIQDYGADNWTFITGAKGGAITTAFDGTRNARLSGSVIGNRTKLVTPVLNLSGVSIPKLSFYLGQEINQRNQNTTKVFYRINATATWVLLANYADNINAWTQFELELPKKSATYQLAFEGTNKDGYANVIDQVRIYEGAMIAPVAATNVAPLDGATNITNNISLGWLFGANTDEYELVLGTSNPPVAVVVPYTSTLSTSYQLAGLEYNTNYYWQINAKNATGITPGLVWSFTTAAAPLSVPVAVSNIAPLNSAIDIENGMLLDWKFGANTSEYELVLGTSNPPVAVVVPYTNTLATSHKLAGLKYSTSYYWQVNAKNTTGTTAGPVWSFTTAAEPMPLPIVVSNIAPLNSAIDIENGMLLDWKFGANTSEYELVLGTSNPPVAVVVPYTNTLATSHILAGLKYSTSYYWQVNAKNTTGTTAGPVWSFTTAAEPLSVPLVVSNIAPLNSAIDIENGRLLDWKFGANTSEYELVLGTSNPPVAVVVPYTSTLATSYVLAGLEYKTSYYWQVNAKNAIGTTAGPVWSFTTVLKTGINNSETAEAIKVYAYGDVLYLETTSRGVALVNVYNLTGQLVMQAKTNGNTHSTINASELRNGIYMVKVVMNNGMMVNRKVSLQKL